MGPLGPEGLPHGNLLVAFVLALAFVWASFVWASGPRGPLGPEGLPYGAGLFAFLVAFLVALVFMGAAGVAVEAPEWLWRLLGVA